MKAIRHLAIVLALVVSASGAYAGEPVEVVMVKDGKILLINEVLIRPDAGTKIVTKSATGEAAAKLTDIKPGDTIEIQTEKGVEGIKKIVIRKKSS